MKKTLLLFLFCISVSLSFCASITINTNNSRLPISPLIYGTNQQMEGDENLTCMRLGGNRMTGYNWENNASNAGADWQQSSDDYMCNGGITGMGLSALSVTQCVSSSSGSVDQFMDYSISHGYKAIMALPMAGYVAADKLGDVLPADIAPSARWKIQQVKKGSAFVFPPDTSDNYVYDDEEVAHLVQKYGTAAAGGVKIYQLDNEADIWSGTHPLIHPANTGAQELVTRGTALSKAIKDVDGTAEVFGPVFFGVWSMVSQGTDWNTVKGSFQWYVPYYLDQMSKASIADSGRRLLDAIDIHYYSEAHEGLTLHNYSSTCRITEDACTSALAQQSRLQAPRTLWDPTFTENSSVADNCAVALPVIPKVQQAIDTYFPGTKIAFTEHAFGGGNDFSGGIATADVLGIYGKYGVYVATLWKTAYGLFHSAAYKLYRNYDGSNGTYGDTKVYCESNDIPNMTTYASINGSDDSVVHIIVLNKAATAQTASVNISSPQTYTVGEAWAFGGAASAITLRTAPVIAGNSFSYSVPAYSAFHFIIKTGGTPTNTPNWTATPTFTLTLTKTNTPNWTATPTFTSTATVPITILNTCDSLTYNGTLTAGANAAISINTTVPAAITEGTGSLRVNVTTAAQWNDSMMSCNGTTTTNWSGYATLTMDVYVDPADLLWLAGSGWHELQLFVDTSNGKDYRKITGVQSIQSDMNHLTFILDTSLDTDPHTTQTNPAALLPTDPIKDYFFVLNSDGANVKTGTFYMDNLVLHSNPATPTRTSTATSSITFTLTATNTFSSTPTSTMTGTQSATKSATPDYSPTATITGTPPTSTATVVVTLTETDTYTKTITITRTSTYTATPVNTGTNTPVNTVTKTVSPTSTKTIVLSLTYTETSIPLNTATPTATGLPAVTEPYTGPVIAYPNPFNPSGIYDLQFDADISGVASAKLLIYTRGFRLIKSMALEYSPGTYVIKPVSRGLLKDMSNGIYLYVIKKVNASGIETKSRIQTLIIIR